MKNSKAPKCQNASAILKRHPWATRLAIESERLGNCNFRWILVEYSNDGDSDDRRDQSLITYRTLIAISLTSGCVLVRRIFAWAPSDIRLAAEAVDNVSIVSG